MLKYFLILLSLGFALFVVRNYPYITNTAINNIPALNTNNVNSSPVSFVPSTTATPQASATPRTLTFAEMNDLYGPCISLPVITYHHVEDKKVATKYGYQKLNVDVTYFRDQMQYLKDNNYAVLGMQDLVNFFNSGQNIPTKSVLLTFDDAYEDFYTNAYPILKLYGFRATVFTPTGLVGNKGYLTWDQIHEMAQTNILFANHTWSHKNMSNKLGTDEAEIQTANNQLISLDLNMPKTFAYPYGQVSDLAKIELVQEGYQLAFTTKSGSILCNKLRLELPRVRVADKQLNYYGF